MKYIIGYGLKKLNGRVYESSGKLGQRQPNSKNLKDIYWTHILDGSIEDLRVGDYVICYIDELHEENRDFTTKFLDGNIGRLVNIDDRDKNGAGWFVEFSSSPNPNTDSTPDNYWDSDLYRAFNHITRVCAFYNDEIIFSAKSKEELENILMANKYNL